MKRWLHSDALFYTGWTIIAVALIFGLVPEARVFAVDQYESVAFAVDPTAARAFAYGEVHFDATDDPTYYDLDRAQMFFEKAAAIDPTYPYLYHELARVAFLQGNLPLALARINFQISMHGNSEPNSYYVRGLIEGYMGDYSDAANDYAHFLQFDPTDWAAMNDDAWVLLKAQRYQAALSITTRGLAFQPDNPWLLNSYATALYQLGDYKQALAAAQQAGGSLDVDRRRMVARLSRQRSIDSAPRRRFVPRSCCSEYPQHHPGTRHKYGTISSIVWLRARGTAERFSRTSNGDFSLLFCCWLSRASQHRSAATAPRPTFRPK